MSIKFSLQPSPFSSPWQPFSSSSSSIISCLLLLASFGVTNCSDPSSNPNSSPVNLAWLLAVVIITTMFVSCCCFICCTSNSEETNERQQDNNVPVFAQRPIYLVLERSQEPRCQPVDLTLSAIGSQNGEDPPPPSYCQLFSDSRQNNGGSIMSQVV